MDNRLRFPPTLIDFENDVGLTGQDHDNNPAPGGIARYDHARMWWISLLANQSSHSAPTQYREGTLWFDLNTLTMKVRANNSWVPLADVLKVSDDTTLSEWVSTKEPLINQNTPDICYGGSSTSDNQTIIPIPSNVRNAVDHINSRPFVWINGVMVDPRRITLVGGSNPTAIKLTSNKLDNGDSYTVLFRYIKSQYFVQENINVPGVA